MAIAPRNQVLTDVAEFRIWPEQLALRNRGLIQAAPARCDVPEERIWHLVVQGVSHGQVFCIQLIEIKTAGHNVDAVVSNVRKFNYVIIRRRKLKSKHPLLVVVSLALG